jgi:Zn-dependent peptidase ImmA (M78 family)/DNA-binding XRE family transcriptional regulator
MFTPSRLSLARRRRALTKKALAEAVGARPHTILRYEAGENQPPDEKLEQLSRALDFPVEFFHGSDISEPQEGAASFRSLSSMSAKDRDAALAAGAISFLLSDWIDQRFELPAPDLEDLSGDRPEVAARSLRERWALGEKPINNMIHLLEAKGVRVFTLAENTQTIDAFSLWRDTRPFVFLNTLKSAEHSRFDAAHELGHLVLHRHGGPTGRRAEEEANAFASSFLMPTADVVAVIPRIRNLHQVIEAKRRWLVSTIALIHRLHQLTIMSDWQYRMFCIQATDLGYRKAEPCPIEREQSVVWHKCLTELWRERITKADIARELHLPGGEVENLLFGLVTKPGVDTDGSRISPYQLRLIS